MNKKTILVTGSTSQAGEQNFADLVAFGEFFIANPDLVYRFKENLPLNSGNRATYYGGAEGLLDYPVHDPVVRKLIH